MKLQAITLEQLTTYLYKIETSKNNVFIKRISITKTGKQEQFINAVLHVETIEI
jgi:general secretion pathway protein M